MSLYAASLTYVVFLLPLLIACSVISLMSSWLVSKELNMVMIASCWSLIICLPLLMWSSVASSWFAGFFTCSSVGSEWLMRVR